MAVLTPIAFLVLRKKLFQSGLVAATNRLISIVNTTNPPGLLTGTGYVIHVDPALTLVGPVTH